MAMQRINLTLTELRCLAQSESGTGSEPYLWTTFFAFGGEPLPFQTGNLAMITPAYDAFRTEFPNGMTAGEAAVVPSFVASAHFDMDLDTLPQPKLVGCVAVLMEEDSTPHSSIVPGRIAYAKEIEAQLDALISKRIQTGDYGDITDAEIEAIRSAVKSKVEAAIGRDQSIWDFFRDQDDNIGFTYALFKYPKPDDPMIVADGRWIEFQYFDFPEIRSESGGDRFTLTGRLSLEAVPAEPVVLCRAQRAALAAKEDEIAGLQTRRRMLQEELGRAPPAQKAAIVDEIERTDALITAAEAELPGLQAAIDDCMPVIVDTDVVGGGGNLPVG